MMRNVFKSSQISSAVRTYASSSARQSGVITKIKMGGQVYVQWDGPAPLLLNGLQITVPAGHPQKIIECREELGNNTVRALAEDSEGLCVGMEVTDTQSQIYPPDAIGKMMHFMSGGTPITLFVVACGIQASLLFFEI
mmetsp:Transcript_16650/g.16014  ORF Transcript_16650/g.16014 Transcript_16650/m.16014 type:complete len:138 (+) Transcript_16650:54-467(+)|eukprot:CAMPEP_0119037724 /NCGR_PEP_ID=MMETSP1177-20130426/6208_1 /TAXON_ID=2985 /ORGANISM="Ochromonas sp, Strain CCMP1899" /LENGTH=137 /DNA_ID=CAMNT_0006999345 /DNA_START=54 /DNA_END=467 /DNA_ORIENTATION=-